MKWNWTVIIKELDLFKCLSNDKQIHNIMREVENIYKAPENNADTTELKNMLYSLLNTPVLRHTFDLIIKKIIERDSQMDEETREKITEAIKKYQELLVENDKKYESFADWEWGNLVKHLLSPRALWHNKVEYSRAHVGKILFAATKYLVDKNFSWGNFFASDEELQDGILISALEILKTEIRLAGGSEESYGYLDELRKMFLDSSFDLKGSESKGQVEHLQLKKIIPWHLRLEGNVLNCIFDICIRMKLYSFAEKMVMKNWVGFTKEMNLSPLMVVLKRNPELLNVAHNREESPIFRSNNDFVKEVIRISDLNIKDYEGNTALMLALDIPDKKLSLEVVESILKEKDRLILDIRDNTGKNALMKAIENCKTDDDLRIVKAILQETKHLNIREGQINYEIFLAVANKERGSEILKEILKIFENFKLGEKFEQFKLKQDSGVDYKQIILQATSLATGNPDRYANEVRGILTSEGFKDIIGKRMIESILVAVKNGKKRDVEHILGTNLIYSMQDKHEQSILSYAAKEGNYNVLIELLSEKKGESGSAKIQSICVRDRFLGTDNDYKDLLIDIIKTEKLNIQQKLDLVKKVYNNPENAELTVVKFNKNGKHIEDVLEKVVNLINVECVNNRERNAVKAVEILDLILKNADQLNPEKNCGANNVLKNALKRAVGFSNYCFYKGNGQGAIELLKNKEEEIYNITGRGCAEEVTNDIEFKRIAEKRAPFRAMVGRVLTRDLRPMISLCGI